MTHASQVVAGMREGFRACYNRQLAVDTNIRGHVRVKLHVDAQGQVLQLSAISYGIVEPGVDCVLTHAAPARFSPPEGGSATIVVPVTFVKQ